MKKIVVTSENPVKSEAVLNGFLRMFPDEEFLLQAVSLPSGVADQPMSDQATHQGARNRAENGRQAVPDADYWVGVEGGCDSLQDHLVAFAWIEILSHSTRGSSRTALFQLPQEIQKLIDRGLELGAADDRVFGETNSKQQSGAVGLLTGDVVTRTSLYEQAVILALIPFKHPEMY